MPRQGLSSIVRSIGLLLAVGLIVPVSTLAQAPSISVVSPQGFAPGQSLSVKISGGNLAGATQLWTSFPATSGLSTESPDNGKQPNEVTFEVTVPAETPPGIHGLRVVTERGVSPLKLIVVDALPVVAHGNQNKSFDAAQEVSLPCAIEGHVDNLSRVYYRFKAEANQRIAFEVQARRLGSPLDPMIRLFDASGRELAWSDDELGTQGDCRLIREFQSPGEYVIELSDSRYQGSGNHRFRLRIGDFPLITTPYPMVVQFDRPTTLAFTGPAAGLAAPIEELTIPSLPASSSPGVVESEPFWMPIAVGTDAFSLLGATARPQFEEVEPNDTAEQPNRVELGTSLNGRFQTPRDEDRFVFAAQKGQKFRFTAITRQVGSPSDLHLQLFKPDGGRLLESEDVGLEDATFDFDCPDDGDYTLLVKDLHERGGDEFAWHVRVEPIRPEFRLTSSAEALNVPRGGILGVSVQSQRKGFGGPIKLEARNLPPGLESLPTWIGPGRNDAILTIRSTAEAAAGSLSEIQIVGSAEIGGDVFEAAAGVQDVLKSSNHAMPWPPRNLVHSLAAATASPQPVNLRAEPSEITFGKNLSATVKIIADRGEGWDADIALAVNPEKNGLPAEITANVQPIKGGSNEIELTFSATEKAALGTFTVALNGTIKKGNETQVASSPGLTLKLEEPLAVTVEPAEATLPKGGELKLKIAVTRNSALSAPVTLTPLNLPTGVTAEELVLAADQSEGELVLKAAEDAEAAAVKNLQIKADAAVGDKMYSVTSSNLVLKVE
jgi:hypothetical protein